MTLNTSIPFLQIFQKLNNLGAQFPITFKRLAEKEKQKAGRNLDPLVTKVLFKILPILLVFPRGLYLHQNHDQKAGGN